MIHLPTLLTYTPQPPTSVRTRLSQCVPILTTSPAASPLIALIARNCRFSPTHICRPGPDVNDGDAGLGGGCGGAASRLVKVAYQFSGEYFIFCAAPAFKLLLSSPSLTASWSSSSSFLRLLSGSLGALMAAWLTE